MHCTNIITANNTTKKARRFCPLAYLMLQFNAMEYWYLTDVLGYVRIYILTYI